jgi:hypothetical protein
VPGARSALRPRRSAVPGSQRFSFSRPQLLGCTIPRPCETVPSRPREPSAPAYLTRASPRSGFDRPRDGLPSVRPRQHTAGVRGPRWGPYSAPGPAGRDGACSVHRPGQRPKGRNPGGRCAVGPPGRLDGENGGHCEGLHGEVRDTDTDRMATRPTAGTPRAAPATVHLDTPCAAAPQRRHGGGRCMAHRSRFDILGAAQSASGWLAGAGARRWEYAGRRRHDQRAG